MMNIVKELAFFNSRISLICFELGKARVSLDFLGRGHDLGERLDKVAEEIGRIQKEAEETE